MSLAQDIPVNTVIQHSQVDSKSSGLSNEEIDVLCKARILNARKLPDDSRPKLRACATASNLPSQIDLRNKFSHPIFDQGAVGSCVANASVAAFEFLDSNFFGSRLFLYWTTRDIEHATDEDSGSVPGDALEALVKLGLAPEADFVYDTSKVFTKPPDQAFKDAVAHQVLVHCKVKSDVDSIKTALVAGFPVIICLAIYPSFQTVQTFKTGLIPIPSKNESPLGGHCLLAVGYDDSKSYFIVRNSWSNKWGDAGYCYIPYAYCTADNWWGSHQIRQVEVSSAPNPKPAPTPSPPSESNWVTTPNFKYSAVWKDNTVQFAFEPNQPCRWVDIHITESPNTKINVRMTYRDRFWRFVSVNVKRERVQDMKFNFTYFGTSHACDSDVFRGCTNKLS